MYLLDLFALYHGILGSWCEGLFWTLRMCLTTLCMDMISKRRGGGWRTRRVYGVCFLAQRNYARKCFWTFSNFFQVQPLRLCTIFVQILEMFGQVFQSHFEIPSTLSLPNIPNCDTAYQLPYLRFVGLYLWIQRYQFGSLFFSIKPLLIAIAFAISFVHILVVYLVPLPIIPLPMYTHLENNIGINNVMICFHISIAKPQLHKHCLPIPIRFISEVLWII